VLWLAAAAALAEPVVVSEIPLAKREETKDYTCFDQTMLLTNSVRTFGLHHAHQIFAARKLDYELVGWQLPDEANWYHSGMFGLSVNGQSANVPEARMTILESGTRGVVDFTLDNKTLGKFRARFVVLPGSEVLFAAWAIEPAVEVKSLTLRLSNYPGSYAATLDGKRMRQIFCPSGTYETRDAPYVLDPAQDLWMFLQDGLFDYDNKELQEKSYGPSGLVVPAGEAQGLKLTVGSYEVAPELSYAPERRHFRLAFFDYFHVGNKPARQRFDQEREPVRQTLTALDFVPTRLREAQQNLATITPQGLPADAKPWVTELHDLLAALPDGEPWAQRPVTTEARALELLDQYDQARWPQTKAKRPGIAVLELRGLHWNVWGLDGAAQVLGTRLRDRQVAHYSEYYWKGEDLTSFPASWPDFARHDVIIFANVPFTVLGPARAAALANWVKAGGALVLLGGTHAFGQAGLNELPLGPLMPVQATHVFDLLQFPAYKPVTATPVLKEKVAANDLDWKAGPQVLWRHGVQVKPGAQVWLQGGGEPFLVVGKAGAGQVAAFCAPPYGPESAGVRPFWRWKSWPTLLARVLLKLAGKG